MKQIIPAERVSEIKEYYFSRKLREVAQLNADGRDIISLGIGGPDLPPAPEVIETLIETAERADAHSYQSFKGIPELRHAFADWYRRFYGVKLDADTEIQPLIGSKEGVLYISLAFLNPGDGVLVPNPGYPTYTSASRIVGAEIYNYNLTPENDWWPDFEELERLPLEKIKLMWVNYPHMPTGTPASEELYRQLVHFARKHNIVLAHDNPYSFILSERPVSILSIPGASDIAIELNSLSKSHNMAGWRVAMLASNAEFVEWIVKVKSNVDSGQFLPVMRAAAKALSLPDEWYARVNRTYSGRREIAEEIMKVLDCSFDPRQQGLFLWGKVPSDAGCGEKLADRLLYEARVFVTPGFIFGSNGDQYIRISLCAKESALHEALTRIKVWKERQGMSNPGQSDS
ncbi:MAG: aminotransferase class I/II-fold pyridoxal phosphate-dependent enzyme [Muribaculaceae bacterium]|nr:aminotransferase class I/II-fold pyridoxal phosphate-dependent enzyme [Muribaculaceae bacterium]